MAERSYEYGIDKSTMQWDDPKSVLKLRDVWESEGWEYFDTCWKYDPEKNAFGFNRWIIFRRDTKSPESVKDRELRKDSSKS